MSMSVGNTSAASIGQSTALSNGKQNQQNFKALFSALQSGDLTAAQQAYSALTGTSGSSGATASASGTSGTNPLAQIGAALQNGDLAGAQQAAKALSGGHHHHHHGGGSSAPSSASNISTDASSAIGTVLNTSA